MHPRIYIVLAVLLTAGRAAAVNAAIASTAAPAPGLQAHWVTSWSASPQAIWGADIILPTGILDAVDDHTVRQIVRLSTGGKHLRFVFSNRYGTSPLHIGEVRIAMAGDQQATAGQRNVVLQFGGQRALTVAPGAQAVSDSVRFEAPGLAQLSVSSYFPRKTLLRTFHWGGQQSAYIAAGNVTAARHLHASQVVPGRLFLSAVWTATAAPARTVAVFGDSITDGNGSTPDRNRRWPDYLAQRFADSHVAVANAGISGARLLSDGMGDKALARFERDVLDLPGIKSVIVLMGINDIGWPGSPFAPAAAPVALEGMQHAYRQLADMARSRKVRIIGATLPPFEGALSGTPFEGHYSARKERQRQDINAWIREARAFDQVFDVDALLRDPAHPTRMRRKYDSGDHLHPGDAGYKAMADAIDLPLLFGAPQP